MVVYRIRNKNTKELERISDRNPTNLYKTLAHAQAAITECFWYEEDTRQWAKDNLEIVEYELVEHLIYPYMGKSQGKNHLKALQNTRRKWKGGKVHEERKDLWYGKPTKPSQKCVLQSDEAVHDG